MMEYTQFRKLVTEIRTAQRLVDRYRQAAVDHNASADKKRRFYHAEISLDRLYGILDRELGTEVAYA